jgi:anti-anti-sigma factor
MELKHREEDGVQIMELAGKIMGGPEETRIIDTINQFVEHKKNYVVLDMTNVTWMNSMGVGMCLSGLTRLRNRGGDLRLVGVPPVVESLLDRCRILQLFQQYSHVDEALKSF